jgi:hypothetical protein
MRLFVRLFACSLHQVESMGSDSAPKKHKGTKAGYLLKSKRLKALGGIGHGFGPGFANKRYFVLSGCSLSCAAAPPPPRVRACVRACACACAPSAADGP